MKKKVKKWKIEVELWDNGYVGMYSNDYLYRNKKDVREIIVMGKSAIGTKLKKLYIKKI